MTTTPPAISIDARTGETPQEVCAYLLKEAESIHADTRFNNGLPGHSGNADVFANAPLALAQTCMETRLQVYREIYRKLTRQDHRLFLRRQSTRAAIAKAVSR